MEKNLLVNLKMVTLSNKMIKKLLSIIFVSLLLSASAYADQRCTQERQDWIDHLKKQLEKNLEDVKWEDDLCYASISHVKGVPIKEHLATTEEENKDKLVKQIDLFNSEDSNPKDINWVPEDFRQ
jgi:hypothetical protein